VVVTGAVHHDAVERQLPDLPAGCIIAEPSRRESMAAVGLAAAVLERRDPDAIMGSFPADHVITRSDAFDACVQAAVSIAADDWLVTLGIEPTFPSTAFGYIREGEPLAGHDGAYRVGEFVEKPSEEIAKQYLAKGGYWWNAGMFVVRPRVLLDLLADGYPEFAAALRTIAAEPERLEELWETLPKIALDNAVAEPAADAGRVATVPARFGWDDIGDFDSLTALLEHARQAPAAGPTILGDASLVSALDSTGLVVPRSGRTIALVGVDDIVVVDTDDAVLVTTRAHAQQVKQIVAAARARVPATTSP
jgi:mannose-1-phosphate guanylyltransferase